MKTTESIDRLFLELSQFTQASTAKEILLSSEKEDAYLERNRCVALLARMALAMGLNAGVAKTAIEGWSDDWHNCVYIELPAGQVSWHFHDSHSLLFTGLPQYLKPWDGHDTHEKYRRCAASYQT